MKYVQLSFARVFNTGNFENQRVEVTAELNTGDDPATVLRQMKEFVQSQKPFVGVGIPGNFVPPEPKKQELGNPDDGLGFLEEAEKKNDGKG